MEPQRTQRVSLYSLEEYPLAEVTHKIISCALEVHTVLGPGLLESAYEEALEYEFIIQGIHYERQKEIDLIYKERNIGKHRIDFLVENKVVLELKAVKEYKSIFEAQVITYLKTMDKKVGLIINFNVEKLKEGIKRFVV